MDPVGFQLELHIFAGNTAETTTIVPVVQASQERHDIANMMVVADAGMPSDVNLIALKDAGFKFIIGSRIANGPYAGTFGYEAHPVRQRAYPGIHTTDGTTF
ncbi:hypothetical protein CQ019_06515 [Arthrobacter sp. MYb229]|nr:hypothetical protein CQ019_06515 [Arthrobacter sp. MYb229]PRB47936.1 hypothetical protein CQ013_16310 [Arthrobacter sp. MYb216]